MQIEKLNYSFDHLEPYLSAKTLEFHYTKHHKGYIDKLNSLIQDHYYQYENLPLEKIVKRSFDNKDIPIFNNSGQIYNHDFYWKCMEKDGGGVPNNKIGEHITKNFGSFDVFRKEFIEKGLSLFGSGWVWLVASGEKLEIVQTFNAGNPLCMDNKKPLLTCDVWEHAYYLDYQNRRQNYIEVFLDHLVDWNFVDSCQTA